MSKDKPIVLLDDWTFGVSDIYSPPEFAKFCGRVYGYPHRPDSQIVTAGRIVEFDGKKKVFITYSGSRYYVGNPRDDYEKAFPGARDRILKNGEDNIILTEEDEKQISIWEKRLAANDLPREFDWEDGHKSK